MKKFLEFCFKGLHFFLTDKSYRSFIFLLLKLGSKKRYVPLQIKAAGYKFNLPDGQSFLWQFKEIFVDKNYNFPANVSKPVIFDCGANVGTSCLYFKKIYPGAIIHAFEPDKKIFNYLAKNMKQNGIQDINLINAAVWNEDTLLSFESEGADSGRATENQSGKNTVEVKAVRLKKLLEAEQEINLLKIDIEGAEVEVLIDCQNSLSNVQHFFIEYHSFNYQPQHLHTLLSILNSNGFRYYLLNESIRKRPFLNQIGKANMDMQMNIFAYKLSDKI